MFKRSIITRLTAIVTTVILIALSVISFANYKMTYESVKEAAGIELFGCANITTGLLTNEEIDHMTSMTSSEAAALGDKISWTIDHKPIFENQYILSLEGTVLALDQNLQAQGVKVGDPYEVDAEVLKELTETKEPVFSDVYEFAGKKRLSGYAPIFKDHQHHGEIVAISTIDFDASILTERTWEMVASTLMVGVVSLLLAGAVIILYVRKTIKPLRTLSQYTKQIAEGKLQTTLSNDQAIGEIADLSLDFRKMVNSLRKTLEQSSQTAKELAASSEQLLSNTNEVTQMVEGVTATFQEVTDASSTQSHQADHIRDLFARITSQTKEMSGRMARTTEKSVRASKVAIEGDIFVQESMSQMKEIQQSSANLSEKMEELKEQSNKINDILMIIMNISKQTNLLALNASIESARAGVHGRGFAIVAEEIRTLSEETAKSIDRINTIIVDMGRKTGEAVQLTEVGEKTVQKGMEKVEQAGKSFGEIKETTRIVNEDVENLLAATKSIEADLTRANEQVVGIALISQDISTQMQHVAVSSEEQTASMQEISAAVHMLVGLAGEMEELSQEFTF